MTSRRFVLTLSSVTLALALAVACDSSSPPQQSQSASLPPPPPQTPVQVAADLPLLPPGANAGARPVEVIKATYEFAARHPEVLKYIPCYCGCERMGHHGNEDCFVSSRDAQGHVKEWETHGMICEVCLDVGYEARQMFNSGASVADIRAAIDAKYHTDQRPHTPTPKPPKSSGSSYH
jgi:hypothetical protein